jgi:hypothetical protein
VSRIGGFLNLKTDFRVGRYEVGLSSISREEIKVLLVGRRNASEAQRAGLTQATSIDELQRSVEDKMWNPYYIQLRRQGS